MEMDDVLSLPLSTYLWVIGVAVVGGLVSYLNEPTKLTWVGAGRTALTSAFNGFMMFCICHEEEVSTAFTLFAVGVSGSMGKRAWDDFVSLLRIKLNMTVPVSPQPYVDQYPERDYAQPYNPAYYSPEPQSPEEPVRTEQGGEER